MRDYPGDDAGMTASGAAGAAAGAGDGPDGDSGDDAGDGSQRRLVRIGVLFLAAVAGGFIIWLVATGKAGEFLDALKHADKAWVLAGAGFFAGYFLLDMLIFRLSGMLTGVRLGFNDLASVAAAGIVFAYLTPGQMGAAPAQIVRLSQVGLKVGDASAIQLTKFFIYQAAVTVLGAVVLVARFSYFEAAFGHVVLVSALAFGVHLAIMAGLIAVIFFPNLFRKAGYWLVRLLSGRIGLIKGPDEILSRIDSEVDAYAGAVHAAVRHVPVVASAVVITIAQLISYYCIPFCVLRALGVADADFFNCLCSAAFVQLIMTAVPLPGGTGGAEGGFVLFFGPQLGSLSAAGVVLWRMLSFYGPVIVSVPMLGLRSTVGPHERLETYGEAHVGREGIKDDLRVAKEKTAGLREAASNKTARLRRAAKRKTSRADGKSRLGGSGKHEVDARKKANSHRVTDRRRRRGK